MLTEGMTIKDIRAEASPMVIWMADATIREARRAITGKTGWPKPDRADYNLPEVEMAGKILFNMFGTWEAAIKTALLEMPPEMDGITGHGRKYVDEFVNTLSRYYDRLSTPESIRLRESDWVLDQL